jgi:hypothetical protein
MVGREFVQEDDRSSASRLFEIEPDTIFRNGMGHWYFLSLAALRFAVNSRGGNAAVSINSGHQIIAE